MRLTLGWLLLLLASIASHAGGDIQKAEPAAVTFHAAHAAKSADAAEQAAVVAKRVAAHSQDVAHSTASALRYTRDALQKANADESVVADLDKKAASFEDDASWDEKAVGDTDHPEQEGRYNPLAQAPQEEEEKQQSEDKYVIPTKEEKAQEGVDNSGRPSGIDVNSEIVPDNSGVEPFGQEEPAKKLTKASVHESNGMIDQMENAQGVEAKRAVYRALTKLRGATIASYDGMAKSHLKNVDDYNKKHKWREEHPFKHLAEEEADVSAWAFSTKGNQKVTAQPKRPAGISAAPAPSKM